MSESFKYPFETHDDDNIMIRLDPEPKNYTVSQPIFNSNPQAPFVVASNNKQSINISTQQSIFDPIDDNIKQQGNNFQQGTDQQEEPPILQDIGIDVQSIKEKMIAVITVKEANHTIVESPDLTGPIIIALGLATLLLIGGKIHFSDIQSSFVLGNVCMYFLFNFMAKNQGVSLYTIMSFLGYSLLPMLILAFLGIVIQLKTALGILVSFVLATWSSISAGNLISPVILNPNRVLVTYPLFLFYISFGLIIIF